MYIDHVLKDDSLYYYYTKLTINACESGVLAVVTEMSIKTQDLAGSQERYSDLIDSKKC